MRRRRRFLASVLSGAGALLVAAGCASSRGEAGPPAPSRFPPATTEVAWDSVSADPARLPVWARVLSETLPATTAAQLDLEFVQRTKNPLGPALAGKIRWVVADALRCEYAKERAEADLGKAAVTADDARKLADLASLEDPDRAALEFARKLTLAAAAITDDEVAALIAACGPDDVVAIVHTVAHANFEDRLFLALGLVGEPDGHPAPRRVAVPAEDEVTVPARVLPDAAAELAPDAPAGGAAWSERTYADLRDQLEQQKKRASRIAKPDDVRLARLPRPQRARMGRIAWGTVSAGYQPELTKAWYQAMDTFDREAKLEEVFASSVFWVVTRTSDCFY